MTDKEIRVTDLGSFKDVTVIEILVKPGDTLEVDTALATLETEKATMDVPAPHAGVVKSVHIERGGRVNTGDIVAVVEVTESVAFAQAASAPAAAVRDPAPAAAAAASAPATATATAPVAVSAPAAAAPVAAAQGGGASLGSGNSHAGPSVRRLARELGVDLAAVAGTGIKGRITHDDVKAWVKRTLQGGGGAVSGAALPRVPAVDHAAFGPIELTPLNRVQKISGPRLHASCVNLPHVTQFDEADITALEDLRKSLKTQA